MKIKSHINLTSLFVAIIIAMLFLSGCHSPRRSTREIRRIKSSIEDFDSFYSKFHSDSLFQVSRIKLPLGGMSVEGDAHIEWTAHNLPFFKSTVFDIDTTQYSVLHQSTEDTFYQKVWIEDAGFSSECRFELIDRKWYLVYVMDQNL